MRSEEWEARLAGAGLERRVAGLLSLAAPSVRLRGVGGLSSEAIAPMRAPFEVPGLSGGVVAVAGGGFHGLALTLRGSVMAWGINERGQLGDGTRRDRDAAVEVRGLGEVVAVAAGQDHSLALRADGSVVAWGDNGSGQLGDATREGRHTPVPVRGLDSGVLAIVAGRQRSLALRADGSVVGWGLGVADVPYIPDSPIAIPGFGSPIAGLAAGGSHCLALTDDGSVLGWGYNNTFGALGDGSTTDRLTPGPVAGLPGGAVAVAAGEDHSLALTRDGTVFAWGMNRLGAVGDGTTKNRLLPVRVADASGVVTAIAAGSDCSFAVMADRSTLGWGWNHDGRLGDGTTINRHKPAPIVGLDRVTAVAPRAALRANGSVASWGGEQAVAEPGADADLPVGATKLGGAPDLPPGTAWPNFEERPMAFVAQVNLADVAPLYRDGFLPPAGVVSFFCATADLHRPDAGHVRFAEATASLARTKPPPELAAHERHATLALTAEPDLTLGPAESPSVENLGLSDDEQFAYRDMMEAEHETPIHRMLGHPDIVQNDPRDADPDLCLLLQVDSDDDAEMEWGDAGRLYYWIRSDDLNTRRFERCWLELQAS